MSRERVGLAALVGAFAFAVAGVVNASDIVGDFVERFTTEAVDPTEFATDLGQAVVDYVADELGAVVAAGDVDGGLGALDIDEAAVEAEIEGVLDLPDLQGVLTVAKGGSGAAPGGDDQVLVSDSANAATWRTVNDCNAFGKVLQYDQATNAWQCADAVSQVADEGGALTFRGVLNFAGPGVTCADDAGFQTTCTVPGAYTAKLTSAVTCAVSASYCTIFTIPVASTTAGVSIDVVILIDTDSTTVAPQFRARSADSGYTGICNWQLFDAAAATTTAPTYVNTAIGTSPADTAGTAWGTTATQRVEARCSLEADGTPGDVIIEWQLETGTSPTQTVLAGSHYRIVNE